MAMHGDICINDQIIGTWSARRVGDINPLHKVAIYDCHARRGQTNRRFEVVHSRADGPLVLASKVLAEATRILGAS